MKTPTISDDAMTRLQLDQLRYGMGALDEDGNHVPVSELPAVGLSPADRAAVARELVEPDARRERALQLRSNVVPPRPPGNRRQRRAAAAKARSAR